jgi:hypothetical protein
MLKPVIEKLNLIADFGHEPRVLQEQYICLAVVVAHEMTIKSAFSWQCVRFSF